MGNELELPEAIYPIGFEGRQYGKGYCVTYTHIWESKEDALGTINNISLSHEKTEEQLKFPSINHLKLYLHMMNIYIPSLVLQDKSDIINNLEF